MISEKEINEDLFDVEILDSDLPIGICATGFIDIIAGLLIKGIISDHGKFKKTQNPNIFTLIHDFPELVITAHDLDIFQQAKAAIQTGILALCEKAEIDLLQIDEITITPR